MRLAVLLAFSIPVLAQPTSFHRLNRYEYAATVRDLLAVPFNPAADFPIDDSGYGFDNIADVLSLSPALMEKYLAAAEKIAAAVVVPPTPPPPSVQRFVAGDFHFKVEFEADYDILITLRGQPDASHIVFSVDGVPVDTSTPGTEFRIRFGIGDPRLVVEAPGVKYVEIRGPYNAAKPPPPESYRRVFLCGHAPGHHTLACARTNLAEFARRAYRRPVTDREIDGVMHFVEEAQQSSEGIDHGMQLALEAVLISPQFLFRIEPAHALDDFQFASRLSYFLWSSMPDDELFQLAAQHRLRDPEVLSAEIRRMLADPKSRALAENFAGQWLETRNLDTIQPDPAKFPEFTSGLRRDMQRETQLFFESIIHGDRPISDFLAANYAFLNQRLAAFYGIANVQGPQFRRVELGADSHRGGILTLGSVLTVSSYPTRTSPVIRGKWILENLLDSPPPPPPPNVPKLDEASLGSAATVRQRLEQHRANPACKGCHARMDPLGFSLENYDAIGRWRTEDGNLPIDATGALPNGQSFIGAAGLKQILLKQQDQFARCLASKLMTYALGRKASMPSATGNQTFSQLVQAIVTSPEFEETAGTNATR